MLFILYCLLLFFRIAKAIEYLIRSPDNFEIVQSMGCRASETWARALKTTRTAVTLWGPVTSWGPCEDVGQASSVGLSIFICERGVTIPQNVGLRSNGIMYVKWPNTTQCLHLFNFFSIFFLLCFWPPSWLPKQQSREPFWALDIRMLCHFCWVFWEGNVFRR